ncbi:type II secretion system protein N [Aromatoleum aromaticum]|uniref:type II secretion system protein N n=1 Tax=Aromatoleum aromaticum TaxID=551760 RepID=UPI00145964A3|nr:type II secretion system protein N [Aromatoleum aromaticum]NMG54997.1 type II secretion system protein GspN [Aromatoleum aromaticum]
MKKLALFLLLGLALALLRLPASLMDLVVASASDGRLRIAAAEGSFWRGSGTLATSDGRRRLRAMRPVSWHLGTAGSALSVQFGEQGSAPAQLLISVTGADLSGLDLELPAALIADAIPHPAARAGWRGNARFSAPAIACNWQSRCNGELQITWREAGVDIVPDQRFGDYLLTLRLVGNRTALEIDTVTGSVRVAGRGELDRNGMGSFAGTVEGDPEIVDRIPNIMDRNAVRGDKPGMIRIMFP